MDTRWNDDVLDRCRQEGDPRADAVVQQLLADKRFDAIEALMGPLVVDDAPVAPGMPAYLDTFLRDTALPTVRPADIALGQQVFAQHGPEICLLLACYALPAAYAAKKGVKVLHETAYLAKRPNRRIAETGQMVIDVMTPGGLTGTGLGIRSAQQVRLLHASVRQRILARPDWDTANLGVPINQEDLLGTLMTFSWITLDGLARMGVALTDAEAQSYLDAWRCVGSVMGIRDDLIPSTVAEAQALTALIQRRQIVPSDEGREMMAALLGMLASNIPWPCADDIAAGLVRTFLPPDVADGLAVPRHPLGDRLLAELVESTGAVESVVEGGPVRRALFRAVSVSQLRWFDNAELSGRRTAFRIPAHLRTDWGMEKEPSFWQLFRASARVV
jgi:hypothetical protein